MSPVPDPRPILITGGSGFIGSHLAEHLVAGGQRVTVVDNLSTGRLSNLSEIEPRELEFIEGDVEQVLPDLNPEGFSGIYHLAAAVGVRLVIDQPVHTIRTNVFDTVTVLDFATRGATPVFIASTSEVYGKSTKTPFAEEDDVTYGPTVYSRWSYACSKAIDEYLALAYHRTSQLPVTIARFFNTVGPRQVGRYGMVVPRFVRAAIDGTTIEVHGDGQQSRCFCDVRDVVRVLPRLLGDRGCHGRVFNIGHDEPIKISRLAELVCEVLDSPSEIRLVPYDEAFGEGFDDLRHRQPDLSRLKEAVGFRAEISLAETIRDLADQLRAEDGVVNTTAGGDAC